MTTIATWMGREIAEGHYRVRRVPRGPWVGAEVSLQDGMIYIVEDGGSVAHGYPLAVLDDIPTEDVLSAFSHPLFRLMLFGERIEEAEYRLLLSRSAWASFNSPLSPEANPNKPIDPNTVPITDVI